MPASAFAEPDKYTPMWRWFSRADGRPFFFAGIWREWTGDGGTIKEPNVATHRLFSFLTTEPNGVVAPIHDKVMPVLLLTADDVARRLEGTPAEALALQRPANDDVLEVLSQDRAPAAAAG